MKLPKGTSNIHFKILSFFFIIILISQLILSSYEEAPDALLWFCISILIVFSIGLYYKNTLLLSSAVTSAFIIELLWTIDIVNFSLTGKLALGVIGYIYYVPAIRYFLTFYHVLIFIIPVTVILIIKDFHKYSWVFSSIQFLIISLLSLILTSSNVNCVREACEFGKVNFIYLFKPTILPLILYNWIGLTLIVLIPTHLLFYYLIKKIKNNH